MSIETIGLIIYAIVQLLTQLATMYVALQTRIDVAVVKHETNSMKDALIIAAKAEGKEEQRLKTTVLKDLC